MTQIVMLGYFISLILAATYLDSVSCIRNQIIIKSVGRTNSGRLTPLGFLHPTKSATLTNPVSPQCRPSTPMVNTVTPLSRCRLHYSRSICSFDSTDFSDQWPYSETDFLRADQSEDSGFYNQPRFVTHIDDRAIESLTEYYQDVFDEIYKKKKQGKGKKQKLDVLDLCSSWVSHLPTPSTKGLQYGRTAGVGMNEQEMAKNEQLTEYFASDLNQNPSMLDYFENESFDAVTNVVSIDYLTKPVEVMEEMYRVLRPGGVALISFSNRCFPTKAINMWLRSDDVDRLAIVASYFHFSNGGWTDIEAFDIKKPPIEMPQRPSVGDIMKDYTKAFAWASTVGAVTKANQGDPMFVVKAVKPL